VPEISRFLGIVIGMFYRDHQPPHFHATYGDYEITVGIEDGIVTGKFSEACLGPCLRMVSGAPGRTPSELGVGQGAEAAWANRAAGVDQMIRVIECRHISGYTVWFRFNDGVEGELNLERELEGEVFEPLRDPEVFRSFNLHPELHTIVWPNGADFAPEFLHSCVQAAAA